MAQEIWGLEHINDPADETQNFCLNCDAGVEIVVDGEFCSKQCEQEWHAQHRAERKLKGAA